MPQGGGDLGVRMHRAFRRFPRGRVAIIGCDIPDAGPPMRGAFRALGNAQAAFGPAADGGYWLVALSPRRPARPFAAVRWSTEHALADTLANFAGRRVALLRTLHDVDTAADWLRLQSAGDNRAALTASIRRKLRRIVSSDPNPQHSRNVLDRAPRRSQSLARRLDPQALDRAGRRRAGRGVVAACEAAFAHAGTIGKARHRQIPVQIAGHPRVQRIEVGIGRKRQAGTELRLPAGAFGEHHQLPRHR